MEGYRQTEPESNQWEHCFFSEHRGGLPDISTCLVIKKPIEGDEDFVRKKLEPKGTVDRYELELKAGGTVILLGVSYSH
jgi:hypothetical protein